MTAVGALHSEILIQSLVYQLPGVPTSCVQWGVKPVWRFTHRIAEFQCLLSASAFCIAVHASVLLPGWRLGGCLTSHLTRHCFGLERYHARGPHPHRWSCLLCTTTTSSVHLLSAPGSRKSLWVAKTWLGFHHDHELFHHQVQPSLHTWDFLLSDTWRFQPPSYSSV